MTTSQGFGRNVPERAGVYDDASAGESSPADLTPRLGTLPVIRAAVRSHWIKIYPDSRPDSPSSN